MFCALEGSGRVLLENELALCIADAFPVSEGHSLVVPRRRVADGLELHQPEWNAVVELLKLRRDQCPGCVDQRLECGAEFRGGGRSDGVSCALASDPQANR